MKKTLFLFYFFAGSLPAAGHGRPSAPAFGDDLIGYAACAPLPQAAKIASHRSKMPFTPENTLPGIQKALQAGVDYIEVDVRTTQDGQLIVLHDGTINRTTKQRGKISEWNAREVQQVAVTNRLGFKYKKAYIPLLEEVCALVSDWNRQQPRAVQLYVDCKAVEPQQLIPLLESYNLLEGAVFYGSNNFLTRLRQEKPSAKILPALRDTAGLEQQIATMQPFAFDVSISLLTPSLVEQLHARDILVFTDLLFLKDRPRYYRKALRYGVDVIQTDRARRLQRLLARYP